MAGSLASGRGLPKMSPHGTMEGSARIWCPYSTSTRPHLRTGKPPTSASRRPPSARRCQDNWPRAQGCPLGDFRCVSRDTRTTSRNGVLDQFKASQKNRLFSGKSRHFPTLTPQTRKHRAGGSIPPISTHLKPRVSPGSPGLVCVSGALLWREVSLGAREPFAQFC